MKKILPLAFLAIISGCSDSNIDLVKKSTNPYWEDYTVSQLLDNREQCEKIEWKSFSDKNERDLVEYNCKLNPATDLVKNHITKSRPNDENAEELLQKKNFSENDLLETANRTIARTKERIQNYPEDTEKGLQFIQRIQTELEDSLKRLNEDYETLVRKHKLEQAFSDLTADRFEGVFESHQWVIRNKNPSFQGSFLTFKIKDEGEYSLSYDPKVAYKTAIEDSDKANSALEWATMMNWPQIYRNRLQEYIKQQP
ncbi:hypothetical protein [Hydrogenophaga sp. NH-16]|uniref:hypothetical protein n=1 Tax=Hydrogenophaga sp. NH-16 TaxID=2184519 RepID=UPI000FD8DEF0|nr:hypothetical protein [Hydrogenophaga sp. NH-16]